MRKAGKPEVTNGGPSVITGTVSLTSRSQRKTSRKLKIRHRAAGGGGLSFWDATRSLGRAVPFLVISLVVAGVTVGAYQGYLALVSSPHLALEEIRIEGNEHLTYEMIVEASGLELGQNYFQISEAEVSEGVAALSWVKRVTVEKSFPRTVAILVEERVARAVLVEEKSYVVDQEGNIFKLFEDRDYDPMLFAIAGLDATKMAAQGRGGDVKDRVKQAVGLMGEYERMGLNERYPVDEIDWNGARGFSLLGRRGERFHVGRPGEDMARRLRRLQVLIDALERTNQPVREVHLDNERNPNWVTVAGPKLKKKRRGAGGELAPMDMSNPLSEAVMP